MIAYVVGWLLGAGALAQPAGPPLARYEFERGAMSIPIKLVLYAPDQTNANRAAQAAFRRIQALNDVLSDYDAQSELFAVVDAAGSGRPIAVSDDLWRVLAHCQDLAQRTEGAFDATINPVVRLWRKARREKRLPPQEKLRQALDLVGYRDLRLDPQKKTAELLRPGMRLDLGGVAKGYVCDQALAVLREHKVDRAMIVAGGDIGLAEPPPGKEGWTIAVAPREPGGRPSRRLVLARCAVATSGDLFQSVEIDGKRYSHIVDPQTGLGLTDRAQTTVVAPDGMTADGLSTAASVLGPQRGAALIEATPGAAASLRRLVDRQIEERTTSRWNTLPESRDEEPKP